MKTFLNLMIILSFWSQSLIAAGSSQDLNLTDQQRFESQNYINDALVNKAMTEGCQGSRDMQQACAGQDVNHKFMGIDTGMVKALATVYSMISGMGGGLGSLKAQEGGKSATSGKEPNDYCRFIAMATEMTGQMQMTLKAQNPLPPNPNSPNPQYDELLKSANMHTERAKTSTIQATGWGATAACYTAMVATPNVAMNWTLGLKLAGSVLLTSFFMNEVDTYKEYAAKTKAVADSMPKPGDCNPYTERECYCSLEAKANDPQFCVPYLHQKSIAQNSIRTSCIDSQLRADPKCNCLTTDSCFDKQMINLTAPDMNMSAAFTSSELKPFRSLMRGELTGGFNGNLNGSAQNLALAKRKLAEIANKLPAFEGVLNKDQQKLAVELSKRGIPLQIASQIAATPVAKDADKNMAMFSGAKPLNLAAYTSGSSNNNRILDFSGGQGLNKKTATKQNSNDLSDILSKLNQKGKTGAGNNQKIIQFAEKAMEQSEITTNKETPLFEIISRRYQMSGMRRLELTP